MKTAHVSEREILLRFDLHDTLPPTHMEMLLDELRSQHISELYRPGMRSHTDLDRDSRQTRVLIYLTPKTVAFKRAIEILRNWMFEVYDSQTGLPIRQGARLRADGAGSN